MADLSVLHEMWGVLHNIESSLVGQNLVHVPQTSGSEELGFKRDDQSARQGTVSFRMVLPCGMVLFLFISLPRFQLSLILNC